MQQQISGMIADYITASSTSQNAREWISY